MASVRFENVSISYGAKQVVKDFSLSVNNGEIMGIIGPSGCGKTTLIRALCGLIKAEKGNIYINDQLVFSDEKRINVAPERRGIGVVFQDYAVWPHLSVWDNVCYPMKKHKVPKEEIAKRAAYALEQVRMTGYEKHMPAQLSGGQQQRVAIARSLVSSDELIVLDHQCGREAPRGDDSGNPDDPAEHRHDDHLHHARSGSGAPALRPNRHHAAGRADLPDRQRRGDHPPPGEPLRLFLYRRFQLPAGNRKGRQGLFGAGQRACFV